MTLCCPKPLILVLLFYLSLLLCRTAAAAAENDGLPFSQPKNIAELPETALVETTKGPFEIRFHRREAPTGVANFAYLAEKGIYDNTSFHRYEAGVLIQGGDPTGTKKGGPGYDLPPEISGSLRHVRGAVAYARLRDAVNPERRSNGSQFYITLGPVPHLDGFYTIFAQVIAGMENVERLREGDRILSVRLPKMKETRKTKPDESWSTETPRPGAGE